MSRAVILFGHGSRDPAWRAPIDAVAARIREQEPGLPVACAFLELEQPDLETAVGRLVAQGATQVRVVPMFLGVGKHAREDLPRLLAAARGRHPGAAIEATLAIGERPEVLDLIAALARHQP